MIVVGIILGWLAFNVLVAVAAFLLAIVKPDPPPDVHELLDRGRR